MKRQVRELMKKNKITKLPIIDEESTLREALNLLDKYKSSLLLVMRNDYLTGVFSEKDFVKLSLNWSNPFLLGRKIREVMQSRVIFVSPEYNLEECISIMSKFKIRHLPVVEGGKPVALLSMRHVMEALVEDKQIQIEELTKYITGSYQIDRTAVSL